MKSSEAREVYTGKSALLAELPTVGWDHFRHAGRNLADHAHADAWEFCYIEHGSVDWWAGDDIYEVHRGDVYVTRPAERHGGVDAMMHPCALFWANVIMPSKSVALPGLTRRQTSRLARDLTGIRRRTFPGSPAILHTFRRLHRAHRDPADPYAAVLARAALLELLVQIVRDHSAFASRRQAVDQTPGRVDRAISWMAEHLTENFLIQEAADIADLSVARFHEVFVDATGLTPNAFRIRQRVCRAKHALRTTDAPITTMAFELGFSTSQYFATVFKSLTGLTPLAYRRRAHPIQARVSGGQTSIKRDQ